MKGAMPILTSLGVSGATQTVRMPTIRSRRLPRHVVLTSMTSSGTIDTSSGPSTVPTRRLNSQEAIDALYSSQHPIQRSHYASFYSSELGGIITDPALMVVQLDDHMVHRGHAVFETVVLVNGYLYELDRHVDRFLRSSSRANIILPPRLSRPQLIRVILETVAASKLTDGYLRFYLSAGRGGFGLSGNECLQSALYAVVYRGNEQEDADSEEHLEGWRVKTTPVPAKAPFFATLKSTNYLANALCLMDAEAEGFHQGIFTDSNGNVAEGPNMNIGILTQEGTLVVPPFDSNLPGVTMRRLLELAEEARGRGVLDGVEKIDRQHFTVDEAKAAAEVFLTGTSLPVMPVVQWDDTRIGGGTPGMVALQLRALLQLDADPNPPSNRHTEVPYGFLTGME